MSILKEFLMLDRERILSKIDELQGYLTVIANPVPPGLWLVVFQFFNIFSKKGIIPKLWINIF